MIPAIELLLICCLKYKKATYLTSELASVVSEYSGYHFDRKMKLLRELIDSWKCGQEVALVDVDESMLLTITFNYC